jgi:hypothetical protein
MIEIISSLLLSATKTIATIFAIKKLDLSTKLGFSIFFLLIGLKNLLLIALAISLPKFFDMDRNSFINSFMIFYFLFLIPEIWLIKKTIYKREELKKQGQNK